MLKDGLLHLTIAHGAIHMNRSTIVNADQDGDGTVTVTVTAADIIIVYNILLGN